MAHHPDEGLILAFRDGELPDETADTGSHLEECPECAQVVLKQGEDSVALSGALSLLDTEPPTERARVRVLSVERELRSPWRHVRRNLPRAASFAVLLTAGAAAALPGSPLRRWAAQGWESISGSSAAPALPAEGDPSPSIEGSGSQGVVGATLPVSGQEIEIRVEMPGGEGALWVILVEGTRAGIFAGEGTRFRTEEALLEARGARGEVRLEVPLGVSRVVVTVNGEVYLRKTGEELEILGPVTDRTPGEIHFALPSTYIP